MNLRYSLPPPRHKSHFEGMKEVGPSPREMESALTAAVPNFSPLSPSSSEGVKQHCWPFCGWIKVTSSSSHYCVFCSAHLASFLLAVSDVLILLFLPGDKKGKWGNQAAFAPG